MSYLERIESEEPIESVLPAQPRPLCDNTARSSAHLILSGEVVEEDRFAETVDEIEDCNECSTDYATLWRWAQLGLLECDSFTVTDKGKALYQAVANRTRVAP